MKYSLWIVCLLLFLPCAYSADCLDLQDCDEVRILLDECLDETFRIPSGPYIKQRCGDDPDCVQSIFSYDAEQDELIFFTNESFYRVDTHHVPNICKLKKQGFQLNMNPRYGFFRTSHPHATIRFIGTNDKETRVLSGRDAVAEKYRTPMEKWIMEAQNHFQKSCSNVRYYPTEDILTADCKRYTDGVIKAVIPYISLYNDGNNILVNDEGFLRAAPVNTAKASFTTARHNKIRGLCEAWASKHEHIDGYEVCDSQQKFPVHGCNAEETVYDSVHDTLFVRCRGHRGVHHLQNVQACLNQNFDIYFEQEYKMQTFIGVTFYDVVWEGLSCRADKAKFPEGPVL